MSTVPSLDHEQLVELFRTRVDLACELLRRCAGIDLAGATIEAGSIDLSQVAPTEYRADAVAVVRDAAGRPAAATITEVQLSIDVDKRKSWPVYVAALYARLGCPVYLLVLAPNRGTARWARQPIRLGPAGFVLTPTVIDFASMPRITDLDTARGSPELAILSALAHPEREIADAAAAAILTLDTDHQALYLDLLLETLPAALRRHVEATMDIKNYVFKSDYAKRYIGIGREEGREEARIAAIELARVKLGALTDDEIQTIRAVSGVALTQLIVALGRATTATEARSIVAEL